MVISFVKIGDSDEVYPINKVILCILICILSFCGQLKTKPFITNDLNYLNFVANVIMILTLLFALFSAICKNETMQILFLIALIGFDCYFLFIMIKSCLVIKFVIRKNSKFAKRFEKYIGTTCKNHKIFRTLFIFRSHGIEQLLNPHLGLKMSFFEEIFFSQEN